MLLANLDGFTRKNKFEIEFRLIGQSLDESQNPVFETQILVENIAGGSGKGYSKKESQQEAAHTTMTMIKKDSVFIDAIFAAKNERENTYNNIISEKNIAQTGTIAEEEEYKFDSMAEKFDDEEKIISEAEEAAFKEAEEK